MAHPDPYDLVRDFYTGMGRMTFKPDNPDRLKGLEDLLSPETMADKLAHENADFHARVLASVVAPLQIALFKEWGPYCTLLTLDRVIVEHRKTALTNKLIVSLKGSEAEYVVMGRLLFGLWLENVVNVQLLQEGGSARDGELALLVRMIDADFRYSLPELFT